MVIVLPELVGDHAQQDQRNRLPADDRGDHPLFLCHAEQVDLFVELRVGLVTPMRNLLVERESVECVVLQQQAQTFEQCDHDELLTDGWYERLATGRCQMP